MLGSIKYNLANLTNFDGRDARQTFWYYVLFLVVVQFAASMLVSIPITASTFSGAIKAAQTGMSEEALQAQMMAQMGGWFRISLWLSLVFSVLMAVLLVAALVRRIHDSGNSGWWGVVALIAQCVSIVHSYLMMDRMEELMIVAAGPDGAEKILSIQAEMMGIGLTAYVPMIIVIVFGVMKSTNGPNRYGTEPVRF